jgi:hypothetical protein
MAKSLQYLVLSRAWELVSNEASWTRHAISRTASGLQCDFKDADAAKFCAMGAIFRAVYELTGGVDRPLSMLAMRRVANPTALPFVNDFAGQKAVIALFNKALERV